MDNKIKTYKHIAVLQDTFDLFLNEAKYRDTQDSTLRRILLERQR
jgi:hypothetical protein